MLYNMHISYIMKLLVPLLTVFFAVPFLTSCGDDSENADFECADTRIKFNTAVVECNNLVISNESGGEAPYTYSIDTRNFQSEAVFEDLPAKSYTVSVKDMNSCSGILSVTIINSLAINAVVDASNITVSASGGKEPYTYAIDEKGFQIEATFTNLPAGTYKMSVKDDLGCVTTTDAIIG
ncbi:hypothetical protein FNH22_00375 [Fulvivirga sp. M361]|uniref:hypothetical protein n=1 Tax=Fulvivirga sp. M361 TaxID=2594266 RepID=UPI001179CE1E|nr:hypothetical protein [Fulvivirga sp. M361]TRX62585.1 hypothetical protein FNH22_00375 [Fulvivirga sp. M361]